MFLWKLRIEVCLNRLVDNFILKYPASNIEAIKQESHAYTHRDDSIFFTKIFTRMKSNKRRKNKTFNQTRKKSRKTQTQNLDILSSSESPSYEY